VRTGKFRASGGKSHSCERPTSKSHAPSAQTISVEVFVLQPFLTGVFPPSLFKLFLAREWRQNSTAKKFGDNKFARGHPDGDDFWFVAQYLNPCTM
jgi:hypothetical protein